MRPEHWLYTIPLRLRSLFRWSQADRELDNELRDHLERKTEEYVAKGMALEEAHRRARLDLGGIEQTKEKCRDARRVSWIQDVAQDVRYGLRILRKNPGFASTVILTLGLGIGLNSAIFTVANGFLLREPPITDPSRVVMVTMANPSKGRQRDPATPAELMALRQDSHLFEETAALQLEKSAVDRTRRSRKCDSRACYSKIFCASRCTGPPGPSLWPRDESSGAKIHGRDQLRSMATSLQRRS